MCIREATIDDNEELIKLQSKCPQGTTVIASTVNTPDFFARAKVYEDFKVYTACDDNRIIASAACGLRKAIINNKIETVGHVFQFFVDPEYRGRRIAGQLYQTHEEYLKKHDARLLYGLIMEGNKPSIRHFERQGFKCHCNLTMPGISVFKEMVTTQKGNVRTMVPQDLPAVTQLINNSWSGYEFYEPMTEEEFKSLILRIPEYDYANIFLLEEDGEIVACLGFWDWNRITQVTVLGLSLKMRLITLILDIGRIFFLLPNPPHPGSVLRQIVLTPMGFKDMKYITPLLKYLNNIAFKQGIEQIFFICNRSHPLLNSLKGFIHIDTGISLYIKPLSENLVLGNQPVFINGVDL